MICQMLAGTLYRCFLTNLIIQSLLFEKLEIFIWEDFVKKNICIQKNAF